MVWFRGGDYIYYLSVGIFVGVTILAFLLCIFDKDIKKMNCSTPTKIITSIVFGAMFGIISAIVECLVIFLNR